MIRILDGKDLASPSEYPIFVGKEYDSFENFVDSVSDSYYITDVGAVKSDETMGYIRLEHKIRYTEKPLLWFEDVNIINPKKYQKYL